MSAASSRCCAGGCRRTISLDTVPGASLPVSAWLCEDHEAAFWNAPEGLRLMAMREEPAGSDDAADRLRQRSASAVADFVRRVFAETRAA
jgi:hypothetical protein